MNGDNVGMFDRIWWGCTFCYASGAAFYGLKDDLDLGWRFAIALVLFTIGLIIARWDSR